MDGKSEGGASEGESGGKSSGESSGGESSSSKEEKDSNKKENKKTYTMNPNNILSRTEEVKWQEIESKIETLYITITTVSVDLKEIGVDEAEINNFAESIDNMAISIKNKNKGEAVENIVKTYEFLPNFIKTYEGNSSKQKVLVSKYNLLKCYKNASLEEWDILPANIASLKLSISNLQNNQEDFKQKKSNINSCSTIVEEMKNSSNIKDKDVFFIKYKNLMQELNVLYSI